ncbi:MAG: HAD family hydrolase, partial [Magnetococcales bacterium]|nr:HAD family hydrolase [Magnetococcales bacterium]
RAHETREAARHYLAESDDGGRWRVVARAARELPEGALGLKTIRVALLASFSIDFIQDALQALGLAQGLRVLLHRSGFAQYGQQILDPESPLYAFRPEVVILAIEGERLLPGLYTDGLALKRITPEAAIAEAMGVLAPLITALRRHSEALLLIHDPAPPRFRLLGILDGVDGPGAREILHAVQDALARHARTLRGVHLLDYAGLVAQVGAEQWFDPRLAQVAKAPVAAPMWPRLAAEYLKYCRAAAGLARKCLVTDLDNTLWGGVLGEEGVSGLRLGSDYPGSAHVAYQRALLQLHARGVLLAIASKNNPEEVDEAFRDHPAMLLKPHHFVRREIHWQPKAHSLRAIAEGLNIGLEHLVFVDDNPAECAEVRAALPMVTVIPFPARPERAVEALLEPGWFDTLALSAEDRNRAALYEQRERAEILKATSHSLPDFLRSLEMRVEIRSLSMATLARAAQLTQKTNQFNLTTVRHSEQELLRRLQDPLWRMRTVRVIDRFGDNSVVGVMMARHRIEDESLEVESFLLSCRVIGRTIETAMLADLCRWASLLGMRRIVGRFLPTPRNAPAQTFYGDHGFTRQPDDGNPPERQETLWTLDLTRGAISTPTWITLTGDDLGATDQTVDGGSAESRSRPD